MATNTLRSLSPRMMNTAEEKYVNVANDTKEENQTKDINNISQERNYTLVQNSVESEVSET